MLTALFQDLRFALRGFVRRPGFTAVAVLSLGLGIGVNATIFTWLKAVYLNPLPGVMDARELVTINGAYRDSEGMSNSYADFLYIRDHCPLFASLFAHEMVFLAVSDGNSAERTVGGIVSGNYFDSLGVRMTAGRGFLPQEDEALDRDPVVVLSYALWQRRFGADPGISGRKIGLNGTPFTVVGVASPGFAGVYGGIGQDFWIPLHMARATDSARADRLSNGSWLQMMGRPKPGVTLSAIQASLEVLSAQMRARSHKDSPDYRAIAYPLHRAQRGFHSGLFEMVRVLAFAVGIILLLACLNVANLLLARATDRAREVSLRLSLGASRGRLVGQLFAESLLLAVAGGAVGLLFAFWSRNAPGQMAPREIALVLNIGIDWTVIAFLFAISFVSALAFGLVPAIETTRLNLVDALKEGVSNTTSGKRRNLWRGSLVVTQVAFSMAALAGAALFAQNLMKQVSTDRGFKTGNLLTAGTDLFAAGIGEPRGRAFYRSIVDQMQGLPQVESAAWTTFLPMSGSGGGNRRRIEIQGYAPADGKPLAAIVDSVSPAFLRTMAIPLAAGREFEWSDDQATAQVMMVNQVFVDQYLKGRDPVGAAVRVGSVWRTIVGVHRNYIYRSPSAPLRPTILLPLAQDYAAAAIVIVRTRTDPSLVAVPLRQIIQGFDRNLPVSGMMTMEENVGLRFAETRIATGTLAIFGVISLTLAAIGLYGVLATFVNQRRREFGVRAALGATPGDLRAMVMRRSVRLALIGVAVGLGLSMAFAQVLASSLPGVSVFGPAPYAIAAVAIAVTAMGSTVVPLRAAARMDPVVALRHE